MRPAAKAKAVRTDDTLVHPARPLTDASRTVTQDLPGRLVLDRYQLLAPLGSGGFGTVWEAVDERLGRSVAVKVIARGAEHDAGWRPHRRVPRAPPEDRRPRAAGGAGRRAPVASGDRRALMRRPRRPRPATWSQSSCAARPSTSSSATVRWATATCCGSDRRCAPRWRTRTSGGSCTATSSPRT